MIGLNFQYFYNFYFNKYNIKQYLIKIQQLNQCMYSEILTITDE